jgi:hypothetical protein
VALAAVVLAGLALFSAAPALAGQAASGELFFYPCSSCHPVTSGEGGLASGLPIEFEGHEVVLEGHDVLGEGEEACVVCHDDPAEDPGRLKLVDGSFVDITGDVSGVCYRCHSSKYQEWMAGTHGRDEPKCTASGCHDPHTPAWIYADPLLPFVGSGFQFKALSEREAFIPLAPPAPAVPVETPGWFATLAALGLMVAGVQAAMLVRGGPKR